MQNIKQKEKKWRDAKLGRKGQNMPNKGGRNAW